MNDKELTTVPVHEHFSNNHTISHAQGLPKPKRGLFKVSWGVGGKFMQPHVCLVRDQLLSKKINIREAEYAEGVSHKSHSPFDAGFG